ncbi:MAG: hypothetical protein Q7K34_03270 [archaeon]|nr:hypothetical protein [archaeon]
MQKSKGAKNGSLDKSQENALHMIRDLKAKMHEIEKLEKRLKREELKISPEQTKKLIEEIKVPSLEIIKEEKKKVA